MKQKCINMIKILNRERQLSVVNFFSKYVFVLFCLFDFFLKFLHGEEESCGVVVFPNLCSYKKVLKREKWFDVIVCFLWVGEKEEGDKQGRKVRTEREKEYFICFFSSEKSILTKRKLRRESFQFEFDVSGGGWLSTPFSPYHFPYHLGLKFVWWIRPWTHWSTPPS